ncbi:MAG: carbohydrate ABC transporter permease [Actinobacteria bacterium]|nr:carbohydrate ABC transporter permease [Actinomycetota bacterium]
MKRIGLYFGVILVVGFALAPIYQTVIMSLLHQSDILNSPIIPKRSSISLDNFRTLFSNGVVNLKLYLNSFIVAVVVSAATTMMSVLSGYALARFKFAGRILFGRAILLAYIIPPTLLLVPVYTTMVKFHLQNTLFAVALAQIMLALPFTVWLLRGFLQDIPTELDEAARVDGCSRIGVLFRIILPLAVPGIATAAVFAFLESWNEYLFSSVLVTSADQHTYPFGLYAVAGTYGDVRWGEAMAAATIGALPVFLIFILCQRWIVSGLTSGAVKG